LKIYFYKAKNLAKLMKSIRKVVNLMNSLMMFSNSTDVKPLLY